MSDYKRIASEMTSISEVIADKRNELFKVHGAVSSKKEEAAGLFILNKFFLSLLKFTFILGYISSFYCILFLISAVSKISKREINPC